MDTFDDAMAESVVGLFKTDLWRNRAMLARNGGPRRRLEIATCGWVSWFNEERLYGELDDLAPAEVEENHYGHQSQPTAA